MKVCKDKGVDCKPPHTTARLIDKLVGEYLEVCTVIHSLIHIIYNIIHKVITTIQFSYTI